MIGDYISINGVLTTRDKAVLPVDHIELTYGFGVYENIRFRNGALYFVDAHIDRLFHSANVIELAHRFTKDQIRTWINELLKKNNTESANIKILLIGGIDPKLYVFELAPKYPEKKIYKEGVRTTSAEYERYLPEAKTLNMLPSYILYKKAVAENAYDAVLYDKEKRIHEGTRSNIFFIKGKSLYTPPKDLVLNGVTRIHVIECAQKNGYTVEEKSVILDDISSYDGAFFTNTSGKIVPIRYLDEHEFSITNEMQKLMKLFDEYLEQYAEHV